MCVEQFFASFGEKSNISLSLANSMHCCSRTLIPPRLWFLGLVEMNYVFSEQTNVIFWVKREDCSNFERRISPKSSFNKGERDKELGANSYVVNRNHGLISDCLPADSGFIFVPSCTLPPRENYFFRRTFVQRANREKDGRLNFGLSFFLPARSHVEKCSGRRTNQNCQLTQNTAWTRGSARIWLFPLGELSPQSRTHVG